MTVSSATMEKIPMNIFPQSISTILANRCHRSLRKKSSFNLSSSNYFMLSSLTILILFISFCHGFGTKDYKEDCNDALSYSNDETDRCDSNRGLYCNAIKKECVCFVTGAYYQNGKCVGRVNRGCGIIDGNYDMGCVKNAHCNRTMGVCQCKNGSVPNAEQTVCFSHESQISDSDSSTGSINQVIITSYIFLSIFLVYLL